MHSVLSLCFQLSWSLIEWHPRSPIYNILHPYRGNHGYGIVSNEFQLWSKSANLTARFWAWTWVAAVVITNQKIFARCMDYFNPKSTQTGQEGCNTCWCWKSACFQSSPSVDSWEIICMNFSNVVVFSDVWAKMLGDQSNTESLAFTGPPFLLVFVQPCREVTSK